MTTAPAFLDKRMKAVWENLSQPSPPDPGRAESNPEIVDRWLSRVDPGPAASLSGVRLDMHGEIRIGKWRSFEAEQILTGRGFVWAAQAGKGLTTVRGYDMYFEAAGGMDWRVLGLVPVMRRSDDDIARSAAGRFAGELLVFSPFHARSAMISWLGSDATAAVATVRTSGLDHQVTMRFDTDGRLVDLSLPRWGDPDGSGFREETFEVAFDEERRFSDKLLPASFAAGWGPMVDAWEDQAFFRGVIDDAVFF